MKPLILFTIVLLLVGVRSSHAGAACVGSPNCTVCTNCSRCAHCKAGGTCGAKIRGFSATTTAPTSTPIPAPIYRPVVTIRMATPRPARDIAPHAARSPLKVVHLTVSVDFDVAVSGKSSGSIAVPAGTAVKLISVEPKENIVVEHLGTRKRIPRSFTDLDAQSKAIPTR